ncbi:hypothetical protein [Mycoplasmopsis pulmonis]|uniref:hypothetical protein n=1 Tax=Mycoplasmopsis pulmonis TaxID=2107 RepID=UPI00101D3380|nr:hypothetical protein [Mycoplasmopsis pulmonis]
MIRSAAATKMEIKGLLHEVAAAPSCNTSLTLWKALTTARIFQNIAVAPPTAVIAARPLFAKSE